MTAALTDPSPRNSNLNHHRSMQQSKAGVVLPPIGSTKNTIPSQEVPNIALITSPGSQSQSLRQKIRNTLENSKSAVAKKPPLNGKLLQDGLSSTRLTDMTRVVQHSDTLDSLTPKAGQVAAPQQLKSSVQDFQLLTDNANIEIPDYESLGKPPRSVKNRYKMSNGRNSNMS